MSDHGMPVWKVIFSVTYPKPEVFYEEVRAWTSWKAVEVAYKAKIADPEIGSMMMRHVSRIEVLGGHQSIKNPLLSRLDTQDEVDKEIKSCPKD
jgi:hypothetical protein